MSNKLKFQKYLVLMACFLIMAVSFSIVNNITSLFLDPVTKHLGLSISSFSLIFTIGAVTTALMSPITGHLVSKVPLKLLMAIGSILAGGGFFCYALAKTIWMFYLIAIIVGIGISCLTTIPIATALTCLDAGCLADVKSSDLSNNVCPFRRNYLNCLPAPLSISHGVAT